MEHLTEIALGAAGTVATTSVGIFGRWLMKKLDRIEKNGLKAMKDVADVLKKIYGDPRDESPDGLVARQNRNTGNVEVLFNEVNELKGRVADVEQTCVLIHGKVIVRPPGMP